MLDEGHCIASCPRGSHKQILHSVNLHLFAHPCCQRPLGKQQTRMEGVWPWDGLTWVHPSSTASSRVPPGKGLSPSELSL